MIKIGQYDKKVKKLLLHLHMDTHVPHLFIWRNRLHKKFGTKHFTEKGSHLFLLGEFAVILKG